MDFRAGLTKYFKVSRGTCGSYDVTLEYHLRSALLMPVEPYTSSAEAPIIKRAQHFPTILEFLYHGHIRFK